MEGVGKRDTIYLLGVQFQVYINNPEQAHSAYSIARTSLQDSFDLRGICGTNRDLGALMANKTYEKIDQVMSTCLYATNEIIIKKTCRPLPVKIFLQKH